VATAKFREPEPLTVHIVAMRPALPALGPEHREPGLPAPWDHVAVLSELGLRGTRAYFVASRTRRRRVRGLMVTVDEPRHDDRRRPRVAPPQIGTRLLLAVTHEAIAREVNALTLECG